MTGAVVFFFGVALAVLGALSALMGQPGGLLALVAGAGLWMLGGRIAKREGGQRG